MVVFTACRKHARAECTLVLGFTVTAAILITQKFKLHVSANEILRAHDIHVPQIVCKDFRLHINISIVVGIVVVVH